jgi:hypothetical protein
MTMASYAVYDTSTGEVVHLHVEPAGLDTSPEEILQLADPGRTRSLDVVRVPREGLPAKAVSVVDGELRAAGNEVSAGAAGGGGGIVEPVVERRYEVRRPRGSSTSA